MDRIRTISRILLILYVIAVGILCFSRFNTGIDLSSTWFGIPKDKVVHFTMFLPYPILMYAAFFDRAGFDEIRRFNLDPFAVFAYNNMETLMLNIAIFLPFHTFISFRSLVILRCNTVPTLLSLSPV